MVSSNQETIPAGWQPPLSGFIKANWDTSLEPKVARMGIGVVFCDEQGSILAAMSMTIPHITDPATAESLVAWKAVEWCGAMGFQKVFLRGIPYRGGHRFGRRLSRLIRLVNRLLSEYNR
jgi:hypothetical protein